MRIVSISNKKAWCTRAELRYLVSHTSLGIGWEAIMADGVYEIPYVMGW